MSRDINDEYDLEVERVSRMITGNNYFDFDFNPKGSGIQHIYEHFSGDVVEDKATGLMWQRGGSEHMLNFAKTTDYLKELNQKKFAGFSDWRLPTLNEAMTLMEPQRNKAGLYIDLIFDQKPFCIWTNDNFKFDEQLWKWFVNFVIGGCFDLIITSSCCVRVVRS